MKAEGVAMVAGKGRGSGKVARDGERGSMMSREVCGAWCLVLGCGGVFVVAWCGGRSVVCGVGREVAMVTGKGGNDGGCRGGGVAVATAAVP